MNELIDQYNQLCGKMTGPFDRPKFDIGPRRPAIPGSPLNYDVFWR
jgi:hypothetical protein